MCGVVKTQRWGGRGGRGAQVCSANGYAAVTDFEWYVATLCRLARTPGVCNGHHIRQQLMDVVIRVRMVVIPAAPHAAAAAAAAATITLQLV